MISSFLTRQLAAPAVAVGLGLLSLVGAPQAQASVLGELWQGVPGPAGFALISNAPGTAPDAKFFTGAIDYTSAGGYTPADFLNHPVFFDTSAGFNPGGSFNDTYILFTGTTFLHAGVNHFVTPHDDGFELSIPGAGFDFQQPGPTAPVDTPYDVIAPADGVYDFTLAYGECCGPPARLAFKVDGTTVGTPVPEPMTLSLFGVALAGLALGRRKRA